MNNRINIKKFVDQLFFGIVLLQNLVQCSDFENKDKSRYNFAQNLKSEKLLFLNVLARHGTRTSFSTMLKTDYLDQYGTGELTASGIREQYVLGREIQAKYSEYFE